MATLIAQAPLSARNTHLLLLEVSGHGGGDFYNPAHILLVEIDAGTTFTQRNRKNVRAAIEVGEFNARSTRGPRSHYASLVADATREMAKCLQAGQGPARDRLAA